MKGHPLCSERPDGCPDLRSERCKGVRAGDQDSSPQIGASLTPMATRYFRTFATLFPRPSAAMEARTATVERTVPDAGSVGVTAGGIPRVLHYVWLGGASKPDWMEAVIANWRRLMPGFEVVEWNEQNLDISAHPWMARMYAERRFAFASDYARVMVLHRHGGVYLDTDVFMNKSIEPLLTHRCMWSFEFDAFLSTCFIASAPGHPLLKALMTEYDRLEGPVVNNALVTEYFLRHFPEFHLNNRAQTVGDDIHILPKEHLVIPTYHRERNFAVHDANNQWKQKGRIRPGRILRKVLGDVLFYRLLNIYMNYSSIYPVLDRERGRS